MASSTSTKASATNRDDRYANVDVGQKIRCGVCNANCVPSRFSQNQMRKYQEAIQRQRLGGPKAAPPSCTRCTPGNVQELTCTGCRIVKTLDHFAKAQRRKPDDAKCIPCQQEISDRVPDFPTALEEEQIRQDYLNGRSDAFGTMSTMGSALPSVSGGVPIAAYDFEDPVAAAGQVILGNDENEAWEGSSMAGKSSVHNGTTGFEHPPTTPVTASRAASVLSSGNTRGFAKQNAVKSTVQDRVHTRVQREIAQEYQAGPREDESDLEEDFEL
ncbi:hypothetical protein ABEF94_004727 [Exophiala dermatitidis]